MACFTRIINLFAAGIAEGVTSAIVSFVEATCSVPFQDVISLQMRGQEQDGDARAYSSLMGTFFS